jgi:hypothetical protein
MNRSNHPAWPINPYPDCWEAITGFRYRSALSLVRPLNTVQARLGEDGDYVLQHDFLCDYELDGTEIRRLVVPRGLITDLTSAPRFLRMFVGRVGPWLEAAIVHDFLYIAWQDVPERGARACDRLFADRMMLAAMVEADVHPLARGAIYAVLRAFGGRAFRRVQQDRYADLGEPGFGAALAFVLPGGR